MTYLLVAAFVAVEDVALGLEPFDGFGVEIFVFYGLFWAVTFWVDPEWVRHVPTTNFSGRLGGLTVRLTVLVYLVFLATGLHVAWNADHAWTVKVAAAGLFALATTGLLLLVRWILLRGRNPTSDDLSDRQRAEADAVGDDAVADE